jgi:DNA polymerase sigma
LPPSYQFLAERSLDKPYLGGLSSYGLLLLIVRLLLLLMTSDDL